MKKKCVDLNEVGGKLIITKETLMDFTESPVTQREVIRERLFPLADMIKKEIAESASKDVLRLINGLLFCNMMIGETVLSSKNKEILYQKMRF